MGADAPAVRDEARIAAFERGRIINDLTRRLGQVGGLIQKQQEVEASRLLAELEAESPDVSLNAQIYRQQLKIALNQNDPKAALAICQKVFDIVLKPEGPPEEITKANPTVLSILSNEYPFLLNRYKLPPPDANLVRAIKQAVKRFGGDPSQPRSAVRLSEADEQRELARTLIKAGKRAEGLEAYRVLFEKYPEFLEADGQIINLRFEYIEAHGYERKSAERIALLEKLYAEPTLQTYPRIANMGAHLGHAYMASRHPRELMHWKQLVTQIETFRQQPGLKEDVQVLLRANYEGALMNYGEALSRKNEWEPLRAVVQKLEANFGDGEGGITARQLKEKLNIPPK